MLICITFFELISVLIWTIFLFRKCTIGGVICKTIILCVLLAFSFVLGGQLSSLYNSGHYIEVLTLSNIGSYRDVGRKILVSSVLIIFICLSLTIFAAATARKNWYKVLRWPAAVYLLLFICFNPNGAVISFCKTYEAYLSQSFFSPNARIRRFQQQLYGQNETYRNDFDARKILDLRNKNIVVVFAEGFSAQWIDEFNQYKDLTPNINRFLAQSVYFDNYYNHTAATFRGLRGQLTSSYQYRGGYTSKKDGLGQVGVENINSTLTESIVSVPQILRDNNFHSYFLVAHPNNHSLTQMLKTLGFDNVFGADDFPVQRTGIDLTDQQIFRALGNLVNSDKLQQPYFIGTYNVGTHYGQNSPDVKYGDGKNKLLNTIHNFDDAFGRFWNSVKSRKDLVVIFTADHAAYPSSLYNRTFSTHRRFFVDRIPFAVWGHEIKPKMIDSHGRNSLDFAPTLMQAMGIRKSFNYFLGCSLFSEKCEREFEYIYCQGDWCLKTPEMRVLDDGNADDRTVYQKIMDFYNLSEDRRFY